MLVGICQIELHIPNSGSLKSKRFILQSLKTRLRNKFNVSVSEVDDNEKWQRTTLGIAMVSNDRRFIDQTMTQILNLVDLQDQVEMVRHQLEIV